MSTNPKAGRRFDPLTHRSEMSGTTGARSLLDSLLQAGIIVPYDWDLLPAATRHELRNHSHTDRLVSRLVEMKLLTQYQAGMIRGNKHHSLILGKYRVLDRLGVGSVGVVFKAEHLESRQVVAVKVLIPSRGQDSSSLLRFFAERKTIAQMQHPNIVRALDVGEAHTPDPDSPVLYYFVMEYVPGMDLEMQVKKQGPLPVEQACAVAHQVASALAEAHRHQFVHRDVNPGNVLVTPDGHAKLLDFGLVRQFSARQTQPGTLLGVLEYIAPEQASDASSVDIRADLYSLGTVLFWALTGGVPYPGTRDLARDMELRKTQPPPSVREKRPEAPAELDKVLAKLLAFKREDRYQTPEEVMQALTPFLSAQALASLTAATAAALARGTTGEAASAAAPGAPRILVVEDDETVRKSCLELLRAEGYSCVEASTSRLALEVARDPLPDLVLLDTSLPELPGLEVLKQLKQLPGWAHQKVIMLTAGPPAEEVAPLLAGGADDYLTKPPDAGQLRSRIKTALQLKEAQDRVDALNRQLLENAKKIEVETPAPPRGLWQRFFGKGSSTAKGK